MVYLIVNTAIRNKDINAFSIRHMNNTELQKLLHEGTIETDSIFCKPVETKRTVWDRLSSENPTNAAISSNDEDYEKKKSHSQIDDLKKNNGNGIILDLGCGYGRIAKYLLQDRVLKGYIGLDSSIQMLSLFRDRYKKNSLEQRTPLLLVKADIEELPLASNSVDTVVVSAVFLHNPKSLVYKSISEIHRILKPNGKLIVYASFPKKGTPTGLQGVLYMFILKLIGDGQRNGPVRYYSRREVAKMLSEFSGLQITPVGFAVLPKIFIGLPTFVNLPYQRYIAKPFNRFIEKLVPPRIKNFFASYYDAVATK